MEGGIALMTHGMDQVNAQRNADISYMRQKELMKRQNMMNLANVKSMPSLEVEGLRMAGFNPAMVAGAGSKSAPTVSQGNADMPQTLQMDAGQIAQLELVEAQRRNMDAQTDKLKAEVPQIQEQTKNTIADTLFKGANTQKVEEEKKQIQNLNERYSDQNNLIKPIGQAIADKWQNEPWFSKLASDTQETIRGIANGELELSVGGMDALERAIKAQADLSDADHKIIKNAFDNAVLDGQFSEKAIFDAIKKLPQSQQEQIEAQKDKLLAEAAKIKYKMKDLIDAELSGKKLSNAQLKVILDSFKSGDLDYLKSQGEYGKWLEKYSEGLLQDIVKFGIPGMLMKSFGENLIDSRNKKYMDEWRKGNQYQPKSNPLPQPDVNGQNEWNTRGYNF